jgi:hypothetical protein
VSAARQEGIVRKTEGASDTIVFVRASRRGRRSPPLGKRASLFAVESETRETAPASDGPPDGQMLPGNRRSARMVRAGFRKQFVHVTNRPARFPPIPLWPVELRADMVAAMLDFRTTHELCKAIHAGDAPRPTSSRGKGRQLEVVWFRDDIAEFVSRRHGAPSAQGDAAVRRDDD